MRYYENKAKRLGFKRIAGVDEAGRGPLAGPVSAAAVILKKRARFKCVIRDSKKMTARQRDIAFDEILQKAEVGVGIINEQLIDEFNILNASLIAMLMAVMNLGKMPDCLLIDGNLSITKRIKEFSIVKGDSKSQSIACASIIAKVVRDRIMVHFHKEYPQYEFARHKGYGTKFHFEVLRKLGPCPIHRRSFYPVAEIASPLRGSQ